MKEATLIQQLSSAREEMHRAREQHLQAISLLEEESHHRMKQVLEEAAQQQTELRAVADGLQSEIQSLQKSSEKRIQEIEATAHASVAAAMEEQRILRSTLADKEATAAAQAKALHEAQAQVQMLSQQQIELTAAALATDQAMENKLVAALRRVEEKERNVSSTEHVVVPV